MFYSICPYDRVTPKCEFKKNGRCHKYVNEPIPTGHLGGHILPGSLVGIPKEELVGEPRLGVGCCEYIMYRDANKGRFHRQRLRALTVHDIPSALEQMKQTHLGKGEGDE